MSPCTSDEAKVFSVVTQY